jgi:hypothetical protein
VTPIAWLNSACLCTSKADLDSDFTPVLALILVKWNNTKGPFQAVVGIEEYIGGAYVGRDWPLGNLMNTLNFYNNYLNSMLYCLQNVKLKSLIIDLKFCFCCELESQ